MTPNKQFYLGHVEMVVVLNPGAEVSKPCLNLFNAVGLKLRFGLPLARCNGLVLLFAAQHCSSDFIFSALQIRRQPHLFACDLLLCLLQCFGKLIR